jgi:hypothetical protein
MEKRSDSLIFVTKRGENGYWVFICVPLFHSFEVRNIMHGQCDNRSIPSLAGCVFSAFLAASAMPAHALVLGDAPAVQTTTVAPGSFSESLTFELLSAATTFASVQSFDMAAGSSFLLQIPRLDVSLHDAGGTMLSGASGSPVSFASALGSGTYRLDIAGVATGLAGGFFTVGLSAVASPVAAIPEPESWLMLAAGLAMLAAMRRLRRSVL